MLKAALWLTPKDDSSFGRVLAQTIAGLAPIFDDAPVFKPHVTIVTGIDVHSQEAVDFVLDGAVAAARAVPKLDVRLLDVTYGRQFFRKVVFEAERQPELVSLAAIAKEEYVVRPQMMWELKKPKKKVVSEEEAREVTHKAREQASQWATSEFKPHLSLVYSEQYPVSEATRATVHQRLIDNFGPNYGTRGIGWTGGVLKLVLCEGPVESWRVLGSRTI